MGLLVDLLGKTVVKLHYRKKLDIYALCSIHEPELYARGQRKAKIPSNIKWDVWSRDDYKCTYCGIGRELSLDHIVPELHGGDVTVENLITACSNCNRKKGSMSYEEFINSKWLARKRGFIERTEANAKAKRNHTDSPNPG